MVALGVAAFGYALSAAEQGSAVAPQKDGVARHVLPTAAPQAASKAAVNVATEARPATPERTAQAAEGSKSPFSLRSSVKGGTLGTSSPVASGAGDAQEVYQLDDGTQENAIGVPAGANIHWVISYTVLPGFTNLRTINVAWDGTTPAASNARVGVALDPNNDGSPVDVVAPLARDEAVVTDDEGSGVPVKHNVTDVALGPVGNTFFLFGFRAAIANEFPASVDQTAPVNNRSFIRVGTQVPPWTGLVTLESLSLAGNWMLRADAGPPIICGDAFCDPSEECTCSTDCGPPPIGTLETDHGPNTCADGIDNDCDNVIDCDEPECLNFVAEVAGSNCSDGDDNDCDGSIDCGDPDCAADVACLTCELVSCPGTAEGEPACFDGYVDNFNAGCNADPDGPWSVIPAPTIGGAAVQRCGTSGRHTSLCETDDDCPEGETCNVGNGMCSDGSFPPVRDTDWYQFVLPECRKVEICVTSEFEALIGFVDDQGGPNCAAAAFVASAVGSGDVACTQVCAEADLPAGTWTAFVAPSAGTVTAGVPCGAQYTMSLTADDCTPIISACNVIAPNQCQLPDQDGHGADGTVLATSDANPGADFRIADNFTASANGSITEVCWWGAYIDFGGAAALCASNPDDDFTVTYYNNDAGGSRPGTVKAGPFPIADADRTATGLTIASGIGNIEEFSYTGSHAPVNVSAGECVWVEVQNNTDGGQTCFWLWSTAPPGDNLSAQHAGPAPYAAGDESNYDLAWCVDEVVQPDGCQLVGACCDDFTATCNDDVAFTDCNASGGRFVADTLCANLAQPCGGGGCCQPDGDCTDVLPAACTAPNQFHLGSFCGEVICNEANSCVWDNGPGDPLGGAPASQFAPGDFYAEAADNFILKGDAGNDCEINAIQWWAATFNDVDLAPDGADLCNDGTCSISGTPCDIKAATPCGPGEGTCMQDNPACSKTPDDWASIRVVIYNDAFTPGATKQFDDTCPPQALADGGGIAAPEDPPICTSNAECTAPAVCVDTNFDDVLDSCGVQCDIVVSGDGGIVNDLDVALNIQQTFVGDLIVILEKVDVGGITLVDRMGAAGAGFGCSSDGLNLVLDDEGLGGAVEDLCGPGDATPTPGSPPNYVPNTPLGLFDGLPKDGTWRLTVTDHATPDGGTFDGWSLIFNNGVEKGPTGVPEHDIPVGADCTIAQDCVDIGCPADSVCVANECRFPIECTVDEDCVFGEDDLGPCNAGTCTGLGVCGLLIPTGNHVPLPGQDPASIKEDLTVLPADFTWAVYGDPDDGNFEVTMTFDPPLVVEKNKKNFLAIAPELPFTGFYQTAWMASENFDGNPAQQIFEVIDVFPWTLVGPPQADLAFRIIGEKIGGEETPCIDDQHDDECWDTNANNVRDDGCTWVTCQPTNVCTTPIAIVFADMGGSFGNCNPDGFVNLFDRTHALTCFAGTSACSKYQADAGGAFGNCNPDGFCNLFDATHALTEFAGTNPCSCPGAAAPEFAPEVAGAAHLTAAVNKKAVRPGEEIQVRVFINEALADLQGYQLHLGVSGGTKGQLELVDITVEDARNAVFAGDANYQAVNVVTGQMLNGREAGGLATSAKGYLATYTYRASADAAGSFVVDVLHDNANGGQTFLVSDYTKQIEVTGTTPAIINVAGGQVRTQK